MKHWSTLAICTFTAYSASGFESFEKKAVEIKPPYHLASGLLGSSFSGPDMLSVQAQYLEQMLSSVKGYPRVKMQLPENSATNEKKNCISQSAFWHTGKSN